MLDPFCENSLLNTLSGNDFSPHLQFLFLRETQQRSKVQSADAAWVAQMEESQQRRKKEARGSSLSWPLGLVSLQQYQSKLFPAPKPMPQVSLSASPQSPGPALAVKYPNTTTPFLCMHKVPHLYLQPPSSSSSPTFSPI